MPSFGYASYVNSVKKFDIMHKADIYFWLFLGFMASVIVFAISYYIWQEVRGFLRRRKETEEEKEAREKREQEKLEEKIGKKEKIDRAFNIAIGGLILWIGVLVILFGIGIFAYQCYFWLKNGTWIEIPFWKILSHFESVVNILDYLAISWKGIEKIVVGILNLSTTLMSFIIGLIITVIGLSISEE